MPILLLVDIVSDFKSKNIKRAKCVKIRHKLMIFPFSWLKNT